MSERLKLYIGSKRYSSWSLRPWLTMKYFKIPFEETVIPFESKKSKREFTKATKEKILSISPSARVPCLHLVDLGIRVHESLAICETLYEMFDLRLWPERLTLRAQARAIANELHANFILVRKLMPLCCGVSIQSTPSKYNGDLDDEIARIEDIIQQSHFNEGFEYLFGDFCIADAMLVPYILRLHFYKYPMRDSTQKYTNQIMSIPHIQSWIESSLNEPQLIKEIEYIALNFPNIKSTELKL